MGGLTTADCTGSGNITFLLTCGIVEIRLAHGTYPIPAGLTNLVERHCTRLTNRAPASGHAIKVAEPGSALNSMAKEFEEQGRHRRAAGARSLNVGGTARYVNAVPWPQIARLFRSMGLAIARRSCRPAFTMKLGTVIQRPSSPQTSRGTFARANRLQIDQRYKILRGPDTGFSKDDGSDSADCPICVISIVGSACVKIFSVIHRLTVN